MVYHLLIVERAPGDVKLGEIKGHIEGLWRIPSQIPNVHLEVHFTVTGKPHGLRRTC